MASEKVEYTAKEIQILGGLDPVRKRPAMYIGSTGSEGYHHLLKEIVYNSVDEAIAGFCNQIKVTLLTKKRVKVEDNGRGIPVDIHPQTKKSALETVITTLHAGAKFGGKVYICSGGLHGIGISAVCALSEFMRVEVKRDGFLWVQEYSRGKPTTKVLKMEKTNETGTNVFFQPDPQIFGKVSFDKNKILKFLRQQAYLNPALRIIFTDRTQSPIKTYNFYFEGGILSYVNYLTKNSKPIHENVFYVKGEKEGIIVEAAFKYTDEYETYEESFANNVFTPEGGTHLTGFRLALTKTLNEFARKKEILNEKSDNLNGEDVREGLTAVVSIKIKEPQFEGQTKAKLGNPEAKTVVEKVVSEELFNFLERNFSDAKAILQKCILSQKARKAAKAAKETILKKAVLEGLSLPGKLADCISKDPKERELFIVEGDSAGGTSKQARDRHFQAILPIRGKILNVEKASMDKILASKEVKSIIVALGTAIAEDFNLERLRYHKIIIMCDADSVTGDTPILIFDKQKKEFFLTQVGEFIENCDDTLKYQVMTCNLKTKKMELKEIYQTIRHPLRTPLYEIKTYCGYSVKVTSCHSVYVYENGKIVPKKGNEIKKGDFLIFPKFFPRQEKEYVIDLGDLILNSNFKDVSIKVSKKDIAKIPKMAWCQLDRFSLIKLQKQRELAGISRKKLGELIGVYPGVIQQWEQKIDNVMPRFYQFQKYLNQIEVDLDDLECDVYVPLKDWPKEVSLPKNTKFYLRNHTHQIKTKFKLDEDLAYLIGFYLGDGCFSQEKGNPNRFVISLNKEKAEKYIQRLSRIIKEKFNAKPIIDWRKLNNIQVHFHSFSFKLLLMKLGLFGKKCNQKFIPNIFFNTKRKIQEALLEGLLESDGFITVWSDKKRKATNKAIYGWRVSSKKLIDGILTIFRQWGIFPTYTAFQSKNHLRRDGKVIRSNFKSYDLSISTLEYLLQTKNVWKNHKDAKKLESYLKEVNYKKIIGKHLLPISQDFVALKVKSIKKIKIEDKFVYDFSVLGDQNFIAGPGGVLLKNSDGNHIRTLLLTLFYRYFKPVIEKGYLYIAQPPLYKIQVGKKVFYTFSDKEKDKILSQFRGKKLTIQRYKGLGEMNPKELWETTMDPQKRILIKVRIEDAKEADETFDILMGKEVLSRKKFIQIYAKEVKNLDI